MYLELFGKIQPGPSISKVALAIDPGGKNQFRFYSNNESKESQIVKEENNRFKSWRKLCVYVGEMNFFLQLFLTSSDISSCCNLEEPGLKESLVVLVMMVVGGPITLAGEGEKKG